MSDRNETKEDNMLNQAVHTVSIEEGYKKYFDNMLSYFKQNTSKDLALKDIFIFAMCIGFEIGSKLKISKKEELCKPYSFKNQDLFLLNAIAIDLSRDPDIIFRKKDVFFIAQEYANGGIQFLRKKTDEERIDFMAWIEKESILMFSSIIKGNDRNLSKLNKYLKEGESQYLEYKSTLIWDIKLNKKNKELNHAVAKTIVGFMNADGGRLLIGISDDSSIRGIDDDIKCIKKGKDGFELHLTNCIKNYIGMNVNEYISIEYLKKSKKEVCCISVKPSNDVIWLKNKNNEQLFVRFGNQTQELFGKDIQDFVEKRKINNK